MAQNIVEKPKRSIAKAISWRITGTIDTFLVAFFVTGEVKLAAAIGGVEVITKLTLYYIHERLWNKIEFGKKVKDPPEYHI